MFCPEATIFRFGFVFHFLFVLKKEKKKNKVVVLLSQGPRHSLGPYFSTHLQRNTYVERYTLYRKTGSEKSFEGTKDIKHCATNQLKGYCLHLDSVIESRLLCKFLL